MHYILLLLHKYPSHFSKRKERKKNGCHGIQNITFLTRYISYQTGLGVQCEKCASFGSAIKKRWCEANKCTGRTSEGSIRLRETVIQNIPLIYPCSWTKGSRKPTDQSTRYLWARNEGTARANGHTLFTTSEHHVGAALVFKETNIPCADHRHDDMIALITCPCQTQTVEIGEYSRPWNESTLNTLFSQGRFAFLRPLSMALRCASQGVIMR